MPKDSRSSLLDLTKNPFSILYRLAEMVATAISGTNRDGTDFALPVEVVSGGGGGGATQVEGKEAADSFANGNPVQVGGIIPTGEMRALALEYNDALRVSLHGKNGNAGDTPVSLGDTGAIRIGDGGAYDSAAVLAVIPVGTLGDDTALYDTAAYGIGVYNIPYVFNGTNFDRQRTPKVFKSFTAKANTQALWSPPATKFPRLMGGVLCASVAGLYTIGNGGFGINIPLLLEANKPFALPPMGNGMLATESDEITITTATGGALTGYLFGTEE